MEAGKALGFAMGNLGAAVGAILFLAGAIGLFYALNALAGLVGGIAVVGPFATWLLFPLVLLSTVVLFLLCWGAVLGFPLVLASLAVERNGALDAVSRAFSYVFSRPALWFLYFLTVAFLGGVVLVGAAAWIRHAAGWSFTHWYPDGGSQEIRRTHV